MPNDIVLVLDDYHVIDAHDIQDGMAFLLEHLPPQVHLVIATRADPALPLARLRARGELVEIRAADLRFTPDEAAAYLNEVMGLDLAARDVAALEGRTEGWIAALQLAALSMQGRDDVAGFIAGFAGDDRYIVDYLVEEVLQRQPERVRSFLLQTSILDRLSGPLCDAVTGQDGGKAMLEALDRGNLFLVPLDDRRRWYRYHHLFADVLRAHLLDEQPDRVPELHRRASEWYEQNGERSEAIRHAMAGGDFERAADLVELAIPATAPESTGGHAARWLEALPDELLRVRPVLSVAYAGSLLVERRGRGRRGAPAGRRAVAGRDGRRPRRDRGRATGDGRRRRGGVPPSAGLDRRLPGRPGPGPRRRGRHRGPCPAGARPRRRGRPPRARSGSGAPGTRLLDERGSRGGAPAGMPRAWRAWRRPGTSRTSSACAIALADIRIAQGRLRDAMRTYERGLQLATGQGAPALRGAADMHVGMSELLRERDDLEARRQHLLTSRELGEENGLPQNRYRSRVAMARDPAGRRATSTARSSSSTRPSACTRATSPPMCARSPP